MTPTSNPTATIEQRRRQLIQDMAAIDRLQRGHLSEQYFKTVRHGQVSRRGPYYVLQRWFHGKNLCERIPAAEVPAVRAALDGYQRFQQLAEEFVELSEQLTRRARDPQSKKKPQPSPRNGSARPKAS
jgi:hypothetical protein